MAIIRQFPPRLTPVPPDVPPNTKNGGRVSSIAVHPSNDNYIIVANQFGGLWKTQDRGSNWEHLDSFLSIFVKDVQFSPDGNTIIVTVARDNGSGGGIWVSHDGGNSMFRPISGDPHNDSSLPNLSRIPDKISAYGICYSPDEENTVYVGTDYGVAVSSDNGDNWHHKMLDTTQPIWTDYNIAEPKMQNSVTSILALPNHKVIALCGNGIYRTDERYSDNWLWRRLPRTENFAFRWHFGCKKIDVSPLDLDKVFILQDYSKLFLYEVAADRFYEIPLRGGRGRGPFVRVSRSHTSDTSFDIWVGAGENLLRTTCSDINSAKNLRSTDWIEMSWGHGLHPDTAYLALDNNNWPLLYGSDGGLFRPTNEEASNWRGIDTGVTGTNSFLITDLAGTNVILRSGVTYITTLYFATQDNDIWSSSDDGITWSKHDTPEGHSLQVRQEATEGEAVRVAYVRISGARDRVTHEPLPEEDRRFSEANLEHIQYVPRRDINGIEITGFSQPFFVSPNNWVRYLLQNSGRTDIYISTNNGQNWQRRMEVQLQNMGFPAISGPSSNPVIYFPFKSSRTTTVNHQEIICLLRVEDLFNLNVNTPGTSLIHLPNDGSLGRRATEFDWHAVFGVDPQNPEYIISPDIYNQTVMVSKDGGAHWQPDSNLTREVTKDGMILLYGGDESRMQVTKISFDPYKRNRILVGTRDLGIIVSEDAGVNWRSIPRSEIIVYITNFFFKHHNIARVSSYGRGLWKIDFNIYGEPIPFEFICKGDCTFRYPDKEEIWKDPSVDPDDPFWKDKDVIVFFNGQVNGLVLSDLKVKLITTTPDTTYKRYIRNTTDYEELDFIESEKGEGFNQLKGCLAAIKNGEIIKGIIQKENNVVGIISGKAKFEQLEIKEPVLDKNRTGGESVEKQNESDSKEPYLFVTTNMPTAGEPILGPDNIIHIFGRGFKFDPSNTNVSIMIDGDVIQANLKVDPKGNLKSEHHLPDISTLSKHSVKIVQKMQGTELSASGSFVKATIDDFEEKAK